MTTSNNNPINYTYSLKAWWLYLWYKPLYIQVNQDDQQSKYLFDNKIQHRYYCTKRMWPWLIILVIVSPLIILYGGVVQLYNTFNDIKQYEERWLEGKSSRLDLNGRLTAVVLLKYSGRPYSNEDNKASTK